MQHQVWGSSLNVGITQQEATAFSKVQVDGNYTCCCIAESFTMCSVSAPHPCFLASVSDAEASLAKLTEEAHLAAPTHACIVLTQFLKRRSSYCRVIPNTHFSIHTASPVKLWTHRLLTELTLCRMPSTKAQQAQQQLSRNTARIPHTQPQVLSSASGVAPLHQL